MDKTAIRNFAVWARRKLIEDIKQKAYEAGVTEKEVKEPQVVTSDIMIIGDRTLDKAEMAQRRSLVSRIKEKGYDNVIEEAAYTWFNRLIALRFMEVNEYLPSGVRVLSSVEPGKNEPDIIKEALNIGQGVDTELVHKLQDANDTELLYRYLVIKQCNALNDILPGLFEEIEDYTEMLLPSNLLSEGSVIRQLVGSIAEEDFRDQVEIIGWMYQYYTSERKDEVFERLKRNIKIAKESIPAATQLFTPNWIVRYMVDNSLGRLWLEGHPDDELKSKWQYYQEEAEQEPEAGKQLEEIRQRSKALKPEEIKVLDPSMGSGHILVYAFDVLYDIYKSMGYSERDIPRLILENNLYGLDIDDRAAQLAYFAIMMKARSKSRRIFRERICPNICSIRESRSYPELVVNHIIDNIDVGMDKNMLKQDLKYIVEVFSEAKEYGSILNIKMLNYEQIMDAVTLLKEKSLVGEFSWILDLVKQARIMSLEYDVVVTNPPYMGSKGMNSKLSSYVKEAFQDSKGDLFAVFIERGFNWLKPYGFNAMVTMQSWMFLSTFEDMRRKLIRDKHIVTLVHMENMVMGIAFGTVAAVFRNTELSKYNGRYSFVELKDIDDNEKPFEFPVRNSRLSVTSTDSFEKIPGCPIAYWISKNVREVFMNGTSLGEIAEPRLGMATADNQRFVRQWTEVDYEKIGFNIESRYEAEESRCKWFPYNKGGDFKKWFGNNDYVVNWENNGMEIRNFKDEKTGRIRSHNYNLDYIFRESITWSFISSSKFGVRYCSKGFLFDVGGSSLFPDGGNIYYICAFLCSKLAFEFLKIQNPTLNFQPGNIANLPIFTSRDGQTNERISRLACSSIDLAKSDWDYFETSWDFSKHPILAFKDNSSSIEEAYSNWSAFKEKQFEQLKSNEIEINRIFIDIYGLQDEFSPEVEDEDITIHKADRERDIKSFISYSVGCMFGRYSICTSGLIYAGGEWDEKWRAESGAWKVKKVIKDKDGKAAGNTWVDAAFAPDMDNVIPVTDDEYFEDDIVSRFVWFLKVTFGEDALEENMDYIAETLGRKTSETARQAIRRYFLKDFYRDHVQLYQKKPVYWLFDSGRQDGFKALIYMHRYDEFTAARVRTDYLHSLQKSYEAEVRRLDIVNDSNASEREKANARKKKEKVLKQMEECRQYDQIIAHIANQRISLDLDDGVGLNYARFQGVEIPQGEGKKPVKTDLLAKI